MSVRAAIGALLFALLSSAAIPADLGSTPNVTVEAPRDAEALHGALSRYLTLQMIRATFDVISRDDLESALRDRLAFWGNRPPAEPALADLDRQLLAEASYYLVSLQYLVEVGGAAFPTDRPESVYANDTLIRLEGLQRELPRRVAAREDIAPLMLEAEKIRALTEGYADIPDEFGIFSALENVLASVWDTRTRGTRI